MKLMKAIFKIFLYAGLICLLIAVGLVIKKNLFTLWLAPIILLLIGSIFIIISIIGLFRLYGGKPAGVIYSIQLDCKELLYFFKRKKLCPVCKGKLLKDKEMIDKGIGLWNSIDEYTYGHKYEAKYSYKCAECGQVFSLEQLAKNKSCIQSFRT